MGELKALTADLVGARADYEVALPIYRQTDDRLGEANALTSLGNLKARTADLVGAHADYEAALPICRQIDDRLGEANALTSIGKLYVAHGNLAAGFRTVAHALLIRQQINDQAGIGESLYYLARIAAQAGDLPQMIGLAARAIRIFAAIGDCFGQSLALNDLGRALLPGNMQVAVACLLHAEALARAIGHPMSEEIASFVSKLRPDDVAVDEFAAAVAELAAYAEAIVAVLFAQSEAAGGIALSRKAYSR